MVVSVEGDEDGLSSDSEFKVSDTPVSEEGSDLSEFDGSTGEEEEAKTVHKVVWLAQGLGIAVPPVPSMYTETLQEFSSGLEDGDIDPPTVEMVFATDESLVNIRSKAAFASEVAKTGWPVSGMALGFSVLNERGYWFYVIVGEQQALLLVVEISFYTEVSIEVGKAMASMANILLEEYLSEEVNAARTLSSVPTAVRRVIVYSNDSGLPVEMSALWSEESGLAEFKPSFGVFSAKPAEGSDDHLGVVRV